MQNCDILEKVLTVLIKFQFYVKIISISKSAEEIFSGKTGSI
jgi:hypothetical protein